MSESKIIERKEVPLALLRNWDKNPRSITTKDFTRLKKQIQKLGVYVPLVINEDNIVLSGNMRLRAFQDLGYESVWVTVVKAQDEQTMLEYALSANDRAGIYDEQALAELVSAVPDIALDDYKVDLGEPIDLEELLKRFSPEDEKPGQTLSETFQVIVECDGEAQQQTIYERLQKEGLRCRILTL